MGWRFVSDMNKSQEQWTEQLSAQTDTFDYMDILGSVPRAILFPRRVVHNLKQPRFGPALPEGMRWQRKLLTSYFKQPNNFMRDFCDAKAIAQTLREALEAQIRLAQPHCTLGGCR
jgi:hypothetical protein